MKNRIFLMLIMWIFLVFQGCSTLAHHKIGAPYSGVKATDPKIHRYYGPNGPIGVGALLMPVVKVGHMFVYFPIDFVSSMIADTVLLPVDIAMRGKYKEQEAFKKAKYQEDIEYAIKHYKMGEYKKQFPLISEIFNEENCSQSYNYNYTKEDIDKKDMFGYTALDYILKTDKVLCYPKIVLMSDTSNMEIPSVKILKQLIQIGTPLNKLDKTHTTLLMKAIKEGQSDVALELIKRDVDLNVSDIRGFTALMYAIETQNSSVFNALMDKNVSVNTKSKVGETPLMLAIKRGNLSMVKRLVSAGADMNMKNYNGESALAYAIVFNEKKIFLYLIEHKADINTQNNRGLTPLMLALDRENMRDYVDVYARFDILSERLDDMGHHDRINYNGLSDTFTHYGYDDKYIQKFHYTITKKLHQKSRQEFAQILLDNGADIFKTTEDGENTLFYAMQEPVDGMFTAKLISMGLDINQTTKEGRPLLHTLILNREKLGKIKKAVALGADVNFVDEYGNTPLDLAEWKHMDDVAAFLRGCKSLK